MIRFSNLSPRTHHPFLFVIPSEAEGSAVRPSQSHKPRVAALSVLTALPFVTTSPLLSRFSTEHTRFPTSPRLARPLM
jgi:hypothetical protein